MTLIYIYFSIHNIYFIISFTLIFIFPFYLIDEINKFKSDKYENVIVVKINKNFKQDGCYVDVIKNIETSNDVPKYLSKEEGKLDEYVDNNTMNVILGYTQYLSSNNTTKTSVRILNYTTKEGLAVVEKFKDVKDYSISMSECSLSNETNVVSFCFHL